MRGSIFSKTTRKSDPSSQRTQTYPRRNVYRAVSIHEGAAGVIENHRVRARFLRNPARFSGVRAVTVEGDAIEMCFERAVAGAGKKYQSVFFVYLGQLWTIQSPAVSARSSFPWPS